MKRYKPGCGGANKTVIFWWYWTGEEVSEKEDVDGGSGSDGDDAVDGVVIEEGKMNIRELPLGRGKISFS